MTENEISVLLGKRWLSKTTLALLAQLKKFAAVDTRVLFQGETGVGKRFATEALRRQSARSQKAFQAVDCAVLPHDLMESALFGHEQGAFTGATVRRRGLFELSNGGIILLDEVGELPLSSQVKLLQVLDSGQFRRVGGEEVIQVDVRVIAATNRDLKAEVAAGRFRKDLYHRLKVVTIDVPPLRERREDVPI